MTPDSFLRPGWCWSLRKRRRQAGGLRRHGPTVLGGPRGAAGGSLQNAQQTEELLAPLKAGFTRRSSHSSPKAFADLPLPLGTHVHCPLPSLHSMLGSCLFLSHDELFPTSEVHVVGPSSQAFSCQPFGLSPREATPLTPSRALTSPNKSHNLVIFLITLVTICGSFLEGGPALSD